MAWVDDEELGLDAVLQVAKDPRGRPATSHGGSHLKMQNLAVKQKLHNQTVCLREAFLRQDGTITGTIPRFQVKYCLRAGGLELTEEETKDACWKFMTGDGRFNWQHFCDHIEKARKATWSQASRVKSAKAFADIDADGSGRLSRDELEAALKQWKVPADKDRLDKLISACDSDGDGNISYMEFVDGLAKDLVTPTSVWGSVSVNRGKLNSRAPQTPR